MDPASGRRAASSSRDGRRRQDNFEGLWDYAAIGRVTNLAARLCAEAQPGQILINQPSFDGMEKLLEIESVGDLTLKGF